MKKKNICLVFYVKVKVKVQSFLVKNMANDHKETVFNVKAQYSSIWCEYLKKPVRRTHWWFMRAPECTKNHHHWHIVTACPAISCQITWNTERKILPHPCKSWQSPTTGWHALDTISQIMTNGEGTTWHGNVRLEHRGNEVIQLDKGTTVVTCLTPPQNCLSTVSASLRLGNTSSRFCRCNEASPHLVGNVGRVFINFCVDFHMYLKLDT